MNYVVNVCTTPVGRKIHPIQPVLKDDIYKQDKTKGDISSSTLNTVSGSCSQQALLQKKSIIPIFKRTPRNRLELFLLITAILAFLLFLALIISLCLLLRSNEKLCLSSQCVRSAANYLDSMDKHVDPCDNFYKYSCGKWSSAHDLRDPNIYNDWFIDRFWLQMKNIKEYLSSNDTEEDPWAVSQARILYRACQDFEMMEENGMETLTDLLERIGFSLVPPVNLTKSQGKPNATKWITHLTRMERLIGKEFLIGFGIINLPQNKSINKLTVASPTDGYLKNTIIRRKESEEERKMYHALVKADDMSIKMTLRSMNDFFRYFLKHSNQTLEKWEPLLDVASESLIDLFRNISELEEKANVTSISPFEVPDLMNITDLQDYVNKAVNGTSKISWKHFFSSMYEDMDEIELDFNGEDTILVYKKKYFEVLSEFLGTVDYSVLELAVWWKVVFSLAEHTNEELADLKNAYMSRVLKEPSGKTRSTVCAETTYLLMDLAVGYQVTQINNTAQKKNKVNNMLLDLKQVYISLVNKLNWMDKDTKAATIDKVKSIHHLVSFPDWYLDPEDIQYLYENFLGYGWKTGHISDDDVTLDEDHHLDNILTVIKFRFDETLRSLREPYYTDFSFDPLDINAYYSFYDNYICVPEGILRYPFYDLGLEALNYGALGVVLGHELSHGFDNIGRRYDKEGNMMKWWSEKSVEEYNSRAECYIEQYSNYTIPVLDTNVDGNLTLSENLADNGGIREAYIAYKNRLAAMGGTEPKLPGLTHLTHEQLFFLAFANMWCAEYTIEGLMMQLLDEHSPNFVRVQMSLRNLPEFSEAWNCPVGSKMNPADKCKLWVN